MAGPFVSNPIDFPNLPVKGSPIGADSIPIYDSVAGLFKQALISSLPASSGNGPTQTFGIGNALTNFRVPFTSSLSASTIVMVASTLYCMPFNIPFATTFTKIGIEVGVVGASSSTRLGIYDSSGPQGFPGARILDAGTVDTHTSTGLKTITINQLLQGNYWLVQICNATAPQLRAVAGGATVTFPETAQCIGATGTAAFTSVAIGLSEASVAGYFTALPSSLAADTFSILPAVNGVEGPLIFLQV